MKINYFPVKKLFDILAIILFLPIYGPLIILISFFVFFNFGYPIFFTQKRLGKGNKVFEIYKFKSMNDKRDSNGELLPDEIRLTRFGRILRKTSLDELPALINVLNGQMSLVGPRPFLAEYDELYSHEQRRRHNVLPGITGWAQINGRNNLSWAEKFKLDLYYVDNISFLLDLKILTITITKVFMAKDISKTNQVTTEKFNGSN